MAQMVPVSWAITGQCKAQVKLLLLNANVCSAIKKEMDSFVLHCFKEQLTVAENSSEHVAKSWNEVMPSEWGFIR